MSCAIISCFSVLCVDGSGDKKAATGAGADFNPEFVSGSPSLLGRVSLWPVPFFHFYTNLYLFPLSVSCPSPSSLPSYHSLSLLLLPSFLSLPCSLSCFVCPSVVDLGEASRWVLDLELQCSPIELYSGSVSLELCSECTLNFVILYLCVLGDPACISIVTVFELLT